MFLYLNGFELQPAIEPKERVRFFERVAAREVDRHELAAFYGEHCVARGT